MCARLQPDVVLIDYRCPGLDGAQATTAVLRGVARDARRLPDRVGLERRGARSSTRPGAVACLTKDEELERDRRGDPRAAGVRA